MSTWLRASRFTCTAAAIGLTLGLASVAAAQDADVTLEGLLGEMIDMERLATPPAVGFECDQQSSYDRASTTPDADGWFANGDAGQFIREETNGERTEYVMSEMTGPGVIVRLWSANPDGGGNLRIYIDGSTTPALEEDFLALTTAAVEEFPGPISGRRSMGANLYFPITYQGSCKVTVDKPSLYYHVGYRTYPEGTQVETFSMDRVRELRPVIDQVNAVLASPNQLLDKESELADAISIELEPGETFRQPLDFGPAAITRLEVDLDADIDWPETGATGDMVGGSPELIKALRGVVLQAYWDGEESPSVECPLGDFFGATPGLNPVETLACGMTPDGLLYSNWFMPFERSAELVFTNHSDETVSFALSGAGKQIDWPAEGYLRFRAGWYKEWLPQEPACVDWPMLECTGKGRFVGVMLGIVNTGKGWWGEGDEKIYVDGETFPSYFGTGSEDYFGYAWCSPQLFTHAYHAQPNVTGPGNFGYTSVERFHLFDDIPFQQSFKIDIEKWHQVDREYCTVAWWYSTPDGTDFYPPIEADQLTVLPLPEPFRVEGALEGEKLASSVTGGKAELQTGGWDNISDEGQLWWQDPAEGDSLTLTVPVAEAGAYKLTIGHCTANDYGIHQLYWDGEKIGDPIDCFIPQGVVFQRLELGEITIDEAGDHELRIECVGQNKDALPRRMFGLDWILLTPVG